MRRVPPPRYLRAALACLALVVLVAGCGPGAGSLTLAAYSTPREAYGEIIAAWERTGAGRGVRVDQSYAASGEQSRAVAAGLPADVVHFSLEPDMTRLVRAGIVAGDWNAGPHGGMLTRSVVVFGVRPGNPKRIRAWADLIRPGVEVLTPNPLTSGGAQWNIMAAYGAQRALGRSHEQAVDYLRRLFANVVAQDKSARESLQTFLSGKGDVILAYENEVIAARQAGEKIDFVVPDQTILIENPAAVTADSGNPRAARAFLAFLRSRAAQEIFARRGYRPVLPAVAREAGFPAPRKLFTIEDVGGWSEVRSRFFDQDDGVVTRILAERPR